MTLSDRIHLACQATGQTPAKLSRTVGITRQRLHQIYSSKLVRSKHLPAIAEALGVSYAWLTTGAAAEAPSWALPASTAPDAPDKVDAVRMAQLLANPGLQRLLLEWITATEALRADVAKLRAELAEEREARRRQG